MSSNILKRSKTINKLESFYLNHPSFNTVKQLYLNNTIKSIASVEKTLKSIKVKKNGELYKTAVKKAEKLEQVLKVLKSTKKLAQKKIKITPETILAGKHNWWIHHKQINKMMKKEPTAFITHSVYFYENNVQAKEPIKFNFPNVLSLEDIKEKLTYKLYSSGSDGDWVVREFLFDSNNRKVIITTTAYPKISNTDTQIRLTQKFKNNDTGDCVYKGLLQYFLPYCSNKYSKGKNIYNKLIKNKNKYSKAYSIQELDILAKDINCSFTIKDLINNNAQNIVINKHFTNFYNIEFINTKYNHLDVNLCFSEAEEVTKDEYEEIKKNEPFYIEKFNYLMTVNKKYKVIDNDFKVLFDTWKKDNKINDCKIPVNSLAYNFINQYDDKIHRFFNTDFIIDDSLYKEIDMKKAYYNYYKCDEYIGLPSGSFICVSGDGFTIDTFNKQYNNKIVGFYEVEIIYNNKPNLDYFGFVQNKKYILFSSMIKLLSDIVEFKFINYCVSPAINIKFNKEFKKTLINDKLYDLVPNELKDEDQIKAYCKAIGILSIDSNNTTINIKPLDDDNEFYKTLTNSNIYKVDDIFKIVENLENPTSLKHLAYGIKAYSQTMILKQMLSMDYKDIYGVKVDSIVYKNNAVFNITPTYTKLFKSPSKANIKKMLYQDVNNKKTKKPIIKYDLDFGVDVNYGEDEESTFDENICYSYFKKYFIESFNDVIFDKSPLPNNEHIIKNIVFSGGAGGTGKTHSLLSSSIFMKNKLLFSSNCWELIQDKINEFNVFGLSLPKLTGFMDGKQCEKIETGFIKYKVIDELTLINKNIIDTIIKNDDNLNFIFLLGDIDFDGFFYQCSITKNIINPSKYNLQYVEYTKSYRFDGVIQAKIKQLRTDMKDSNNVYELYIKFKKLFTDNFYNKETLIFNNDDIGISALKPIDEKTNICKFSQQFFNTGSKKQYYIKDTYYKKGIYKGKKLDDKPENNKNYCCSLFRTIHSYQGRQLSHTNRIIILINSLFDFNLLYTAISRARRLDQIIIIDDLKDNKLVQQYLNYVSRTIQ